MRSFTRALLYLAFLTILGASIFQLPNIALAQNESPAAIKIDPKIFDAYVGQYQDARDPEMILSFFREADKYYVSATDQAKVEIFPESKKRFFVKAFPAAVDFVRDGNGKVVSIVWHQAAKDTPLKKISDHAVKQVNIAFSRTEVMIPMRDGVKLFTVILAPKDQTGTLPIILERTPYGVKDAYTSDFLNAAEKDLVADGYIFVFQDIRGKYGSEGDFVMVRPVQDHSDPKAIDESTDTYDTIDWLIKNVPKNSRSVGIKGVSYDGWLSTMAVIDPHPALKASSPQAPVADFWMGDDFFHNGAFRQSYGYEYVKAMETSKTFEAVSFGKEDAYDLYLSFKTLSNITTKLNGQFPTWNNFVAHPAYDSFWQTRAVKNSIHKITVPTMVVGGWWDQEDLYGAITTYKILEGYDKNNIVSLVEGPWNHGGWRRQGRSLAGIDFGSSTGRYYRKNIEAPFFAYYLKSKGHLPTAQAYIFQAGTNKWMTYDAWPPKREVQKRDLYIQADHGLSFEKPKKVKTGNDFDSYVSDPADPVPYRKHPIEATYDPKGSNWYTWLAQDQQFLNDRNDVLKWQTEPLSETVTFSGDIVAHLFASTTRTDSDWVVKLIDVYPTNDTKTSGYQLMVASEIFRGRYLKSFEKPQPLVPGQVNEYIIDLHGNDYAFLKGHRIMVQVQSSWFPLYDRNPQNFVDNIFLAKESDYQPATQRIYRSAQYPSHINVTVASGSTMRTP